MDRRTFINLTASVPVLMQLALPGPVWAAERIDRLVFSNTECKMCLTPEQFDILREEGTERPFSSPLDHETRSGLYVCAACRLPLFPSRFKYDSGTGWPSFYDVLPGHGETKTVLKLLLPRTEYHCARCGGHHGHVFKDGPKPTGLRYCNNGAVLTFIPDTACPWRSCSIRITPAIPRIRLHGNRSHAQPPGCGRFHTTADRRAHKAQAAGAGRN